MDRTTCRFLLQLTETTVYIIFIVVKQCCTCLFIYFFVRCQAYWSPFIYPFLHILLLCLFSVQFRTTPMDNTGVPHILEHTVLCGSQRFPCRDPFFKMLNRSLSTFMNAFTGNDYPQCVSECIVKQPYNSIFCCSSCCD